MQRIIGWAALLAFALVTKLFFVDRYFPDPPANMLIWLPITMVVMVVQLVVFILYGLATGQHRRRD